VRFLLSAVYWNFLQGNSRKVLTFRGLSREHAFPQDKSKLSTDFTMGKPALTQNNSRLQAFPRIILQKGMPFRLRKVNKKLLQWIITKIETELLAKMITEHTILKNFDHKIVAKYPRRKILTWRAKIKWEQKMKTKKLSKKKVIVLKDRKS
jgi:hypothetical protein